jgi:hypothetical protein
MAIPGIQWGLQVLGIPIPPIFGIISIAVGGLLILFTFYLIFTSYILPFFKNRISIKQGGNKIIISLGIIILVVGIISGSVLIASQLNIKTDTKITTVYCCLNGNTYQVWADNKGDDIDTIIIKLGTSGLITEFRAIMGASLPKIIEGGTNANFITFEIDKLPPDTSLAYLISSVLLQSDEKIPRQFTAWSVVTKKNITTKFLGECPKIIKVGPEETAPPR